MIMQIQSLVNKGHNELSIAKIIGKNRKYVRIFMLENGIEPAIDKEKEYQNIAKRLITVKDQCVFFKEMSKLSGVSISQTLTVTKMYDIVPSKVSICVVCGEIIDTEKSTVSRKYCSKRCTNVAFRKTTERKPILKDCKVCGTSFEGSPNSKFCSDACKSLAKDIQGGIKCLKGL